MKGDETLLVAQPETPIDSKEASKLLGLSLRTLTRLADKGEIPGFKVGDQWRFYRSELEAYIQRQRRDKK